MRQSIERMGSSAALHRNHRAINFLLEHGALVDIFACAYLGNAPDANLLLERDPGLVWLATRDGMTPLHYAARAGHLAVAEILVRHHADVNAVDNRGRSILMEACHAGPWKSKPAEDLIQLLLDHDAKIDLWEAAAMGSTRLVELMLDRNSERIDNLDVQGKTALFHAAGNNQFAAVKLLIERGADPNLSDAVGIAALHRTSNQCSDELIRFLIDHGADAHLCCHVACGDEVGTLQKLARNPDAIHEMVYGFNAVGYAIHCWQLGTLRILLHHGGRLSPEDQRHVQRISDDDQKLLDELLAIEVK